MPLAQPGPAASAAASLPTWSPALTALSGPEHVPAPTAATLAVLAERYGTGVPLSCEPVAQGLLNRGYRLETAGGRYFLKHHLDGVTHAIDRQHRATARLAARGLPLAPPLADAHGRTVAEAGGHCYALHPWVVGHHRHGDELSAAASRRLGALLGRVHTALEEVMAPTDRPAPPPAPASTSGSATAPKPVPPTAPTPTTTLMPTTTLTPSADPVDTDALIGDLLGRVRSSSRPDAFDELAEHRLLERRELLWRWAAHRPGADAVPARGWVHGDFHPLNLLYGNASCEPVAIIDWDRLDVQPRAEEAVRAGVLFFVRPDGSLDLPKVAAYARGYREAARVRGDELEAAVYRVWWERLNDFWMLRWRYQLSDRRADPLFPASSALVLWWTRNYEAVRDAFRGTAP